MKNEIGRKLTSLTIMAIMFAGGMTVAAPSVMPEVFADFSETDGTSYDMVQGANGKWYAYAVDASISTLLDADGDGMDYGTKCTTGLGVNTGHGGEVGNTEGTRNTANILGNEDWDVWTEATASATASVSGACLNINNMIGTLDDTAGTTSRTLLSNAVLQGAPSLSNWNGVVANSTLIDLGQRGHSLNASGYGSWPYIYTFEFPSTTNVAYGGDSIDVTFGNTYAEGVTSISLGNQSPADLAQLQLSITDPALNIDPTSADRWIFNLAAPSSSDHSILFANNVTDTTGLSGGSGAISLAELGDMQFSGNGLLKNSTGSANAIVDGLASVIMTENDNNSATFESWATNGSSQLVTIDEAGGDKRVVFTYGGDSVDMIITYNDASLSFDGGSGDWIAGETAYITVTDADQNRYPSSAETLAIGDETVQIPTIVVGSPLTLANSDGNNNLAAGASSNTAGVVVGSGTGAGLATLTVNNTTDNSERLRITHSAIDTATQGAGGVVPPATAVGLAELNNTWINVTTAHTVDDLVNLAGTVVLNYDISGPAGDLSSTAVEVFMLTTGKNSSSSGSATTAAGDDFYLVSSGNDRAGVVGLHNGTAASDAFIRNTDISTVPSTIMSAQTTLNLADTTNVGLAFKITHAFGTFLNATADYAIAADFCNFDQDNGSSVHNCIYRIEAEETGDNTGVFEGAASYIMLNNSTSASTDNGEHDGNDEQVHGMLTTNSDEVTIVLMSSVSGGDAIRVVYNDTDAGQSGSKLGAQIDTVTHSGTAGLDANDYEAGDMATITIVDADLNQDSSVRDVYQNSSRTFQMNVTGASGTAHMPFATSPITIIETTNDSGIFVGTFTVPDYKGQDVALTYYDSLDGSGSSVEVYDESSVSSNTGTVSFDRSVYPVPFSGSSGCTNCATDASDLRKGDGSTTGQTEAGNVTMTISVSDADFTGDVLNVTDFAATGTILVKLIEGATTSTCFTAGSASSSTTTSTTVLQELGPLSATEIGSSVFEVEFTVDEVQHCGANMRTITSGDVMQVQYVDSADDGGGSSTSYDSSTFDLRTGSLSVDKDVYVLGSDVVITLTDPDLNLDGGSTESYALSLIEWDSSADSSELLNDTDNFTAMPSKLQETGDNTGVFQSVVTLPSASLYPGGDTSATKVVIDYGEAVTLTYVDVGISGEDTTEDDTLDVEAYFSISNFGALIELDKAVYNWTDTVYIDITSPDHNVNSASEETIGTTSLPIQVSTRVGKMCTSSSTNGATYQAAESGVDTGIFTAEVALEGFDHTMSSDTSSRNSQGELASSTCGSSNTDGIIRTSAQTDGISVSYEYNDGSVVVASASIVWNIGEASWDTSVASAGGSAVVTVVDADENLDSTLTDAFTGSVYSDSDSGGFTLTFNETDEDTGVFEGTVYFTSDAATSGSNLRVSEGDTVTVEYTDETLPEPYTTSDDLTIAATLTIGTAFPPLERAPAANARVVDAFGSSVAEVTVDQQVQIAADVSNGQSSEQAFAYLVQVQDGNGVTVSLAWITGSLTAGQSMSPALSWTPDASGSYTATVFVWESVDNPTALSPTVSVNIDVV